MAIYAVTHSKKEIEKHDVVKDFVHKGHIKLRKASDYQSLEEGLFRTACFWGAHYHIPTVESVEFLKDTIGTRLDETIEVGSGSGQLAHHLGIQGTDNYSQEHPDIADRFKRAGQIPVSYGKNVLRYDYEKAVEKLQPKVVVAAWVTYPLVDLSLIIEKVEEIIFIGSHRVHGSHPVMQLKNPITHENPEGFISRNEDNFVYIFKNNS